MVSVMVGRTVVIDVPITVFMMKMRALVPVMMVMMVIIMVM